MTNKQFAIVGGGIGGLTLAIALQQKGFKVKVYENAPQLKTLGAGLALAANAINAFKEIGIADDIIKAGNILRVLHIKDVKGNVLAATNSEKLSKKFGTVNNFTIHRAELHEVLLSKLTPGTVELGKGCFDFIQTDQGVTLLFKDGTSAEADFVIACDGIHSNVRKKLLPDATPRYAGYTCFRAVINNVPDDIDLTETSETWGPGLRFGIAPLTNNRIYWFACINTTANNQELKSAKVDDLLKRFGKFHDPVARILKSTDNDQLIWSDIIDLKPLKNFAFGNIVLMGDAAHATTPNMGQGACMAIEDAAILANCISATDNTSAAFLAFEKKRIRRTTTIVNDSWRIGKVAQLENRLAISLRNFALKLTPESVAEKQLRFLTEVSYR